MTKEEIKAELEKIAKDNNYTLTNNVDRIINAKLRFFGEENWRNCSFNANQSKKRKFLEKT